MRAAPLIAVFAAIAGQAFAQSPAVRPQTVETIVFTAKKVDVRQLSKEERLKRACKAARFLLSELQDRKNNDAFLIDTTGWLIQLSCLTPK